ncbi:hypothetical protein ACTHQF_15720 [Pedobacter sp. SAFR-022]|uniref:hypothetical protein n=1 Tax=Pedobacter sp. SAFR-022 TaxID=3436861 RepID=UPI003F7DD2A5
MVIIPLLPVNLQIWTLILLQAAGMDDPGMPGGDPDLPETPLDAGVYILIIITLLYGVWKIRRSKRPTI